MLHGPGGRSFSSISHRSGRQPHVASGSALTLTVSLASPGPSVSTTQCRGRARAARRVCTARATISSFAPSSLRREASADTCTRGRGDAGRACPTPARCGRSARSGRCIRRRRPLAALLAPEGCSGRRAADRAGAATAYGRQSPEVGRIRKLEAARDMPRERLRFPLKLCEAALRFRDGRRRRNDPSETSARPVLSHKKEC